MTEITQNIFREIIANTATLGVDFVVNGGTYGMGFVAGAKVQATNLAALSSLRSWLNGYTVTSRVLKYGYYPAFLVQVGLVEGVKHSGSGFINQHSDAIMPALVGVLTTPACSIAAINESTPNANLRLMEMLKKTGLRSVLHVSSGMTPIALREMLCFQALHHDTTTWAQQIADSSAAYPRTSIAFRRQDGSATPLSHCLASVFDVVAILAGQPLSTLASQAAILKHQRSLQPATTPSTGMLSSRLTFWRDTCKQIVEKGKASGLSPIRSFAPGTAIRTFSLLGTLGVFNICYPIFDKRADELLRMRNR